MSKNDKWSTLNQLIGPKKTFFVSLVCLIAVSVIMESFGFAMIIPFFEVYLDSDSNSIVSSSLTSFFSFTGIEKSTINISVIFFTAMALKNILKVLRERLRSKFSYECRRDWMTQVYSNFCYVDYSKFSEHKQGQLINIIIQETLKAATGILQFTELLTGIITVPLYISLLFLANPQITLAASMVGLVFYISLKKFIKSYSNKVGDRELELNKSISEKVTEDVSAMRSIRTFNLESKFIKQLYKMADEFKKLIVDWDTYTAVTNPLIETMLVLGVVVFLWYSSEHYGKDYFKSILPVVSMMVIVAHKTMGQLSRLLVNKMVVEKYMPSFKLILKYLSLHARSEELEKKPKQSLVDLDYSKGIHFHETSFSFGPHKVLHKVSFQIQPKSLTILAGQTGSGKSTIVDLLLKLYKVDEGQITIGGVNINDIGEDQWRKSIALVSQDTFLFNDTILNNLLVANPNASEKDIKAALVNSGSFDFVKNLPNGIHTHVGDRGSNLSGGQRQRISIARAILKNAAIIILDEATSALDKKNQEFINKYISSLKNEKIILSISHREEIFKYADYILTIDPETKQVTSMNQSKVFENKDENHSVKL